VVVLVVLSAVGVRLRAMGAAAVAECDQALGAGDIVTAVGRAREAAMAVAPGSPYPEQGYTRLVGIAEGAEARGDLDQATLAWRAVWTAIRATRSEQREGARLEDCRRALVRLARRACAGSVTRPPEACAAATEAALAQDSLPATASSWWFALGAVLFLGGGAAAIRVEEGRRRTALAVVAGVGAAVIAMVISRG
jgi:hypothetical protein